jgi:hypothetical protein
MVNSFYAAGWLMVNGLNNQVKAFFISFFVEPIFAFVLSTKSSASSLTPA